MSPSEPSQPHDALFKAAFHPPEAAASQIRALLPAPLVEHLDLDGIEEAGTETVDPALHKRDRALLFRVPLRGSEHKLLFVLHEHQSTEPPLAPFRFLQYAVGSWGRWLDQQTEPPGQLLLPGMVALVLYHGAAPWKGPRALHDMIDLPRGLLQELGSFVPNLKLKIDDLREVSDDDLEARGAPPLASFALHLFKHGPAGDDLVEVWRRRSKDVAALRQKPDWSLGLEQVTRYTCAVGDVDVSLLAQIAAEAAGQEAKEVVMTTAERLKQEGRQEGQRRGRYELLLRQLRAKFGRNAAAAVEQRLVSAASEQLDSWGERVLTAATLDEVFAE